MNAAKHHGTALNRAKATCRVVIYPASRERHNKPYWPYARHCLHRARINGLCLQHARMTITETLYRDACPR